MKNYLLWLIPAFLFLFIGIGCHKEDAKPPAALDIVAQAKQYVSTNLQGQSANSNSDAGVYTPTNRILRWDNIQLENAGDKASLWIPVNYRQVSFITVNIDPHRLFNTDYLQQLHLWQDSTAAFHSELVTRFPDSDYVYGKGQFTGIVLVRDWQDNYLQEMIYQKNGKILKRMNTQQVSPDRNTPANNLDEICFYSFGYTYAVQARVEEVFYWENNLGCFSFFSSGGGGGSSGGIWSGGYGNPPANDNSGGGAAPAYPNNPPAVPNVTIINGNNIIADVKDYNKCFDNISGSDHHYTVKLCVNQPVPGSRDAWGFTSNLSSASSDLVSAGHTFLIFTDQRTNTTITRNIGFYPSSGASPISPVDQGQLNNDAESDYNVSLTIEVDNSKFFTILDYVSHGNDPGYNYDLNSNNCSTFAIRALASAGINLPVYPGTWPNGGGYDPGDLGEDIKNMMVTPSMGMTRNTEPTAHPNQGNCQ